MNNNEAMSSTSIPYMISLKAQCQCILSFPQFQVVSYWHQFIMHAKVYMILIRDFYASSKVFVESTILGVCHIRMAISLMAQN